MNCKPGDLAIVVGDSQYAGMLVEVLYAAPGHYFTLPDGYSHEPSEPNCWVLKILGSARNAPLYTNGKPNGKWRSTQYGCGKDSKLRPLPGNTLDAQRDERITA